MSAADVAEIRSRVLAEHVLLRRHVAEISRHCRSTASERQRTHLVSALDELKELLHRHLAYEERALVPILLEADAWGPVRVERLEQEHAQQRLVLVALSEDASERPVEELVEELLWFVTALERDMDDEDRTLLEDEQALGGSPISMEQLDG